MPYLTNELGFTLGHFTEQCRSKLIYTRQPLPDRPETGEMECDIICTNCRQRLTLRVLSIETTETRRSTKLIIANIMTIAAIGLVMHAGSLQLDPLTHQYPDSIYWFYGLGALLMIGGIGMFTASASDQGIHLSVPLGSGASLGPYHHRLLKRR